MGKENISQPSSKKAKKALPIEVIEKIYNFKSDNPQEEKTKDMWLFAYFANGMKDKNKGLSLHARKRNFIPFLRIAEYLCYLQEKFIEISIKP